MTELASATLVRPVRGEDYDAWLPLWQGYHAFYRNPLREVVTATTWARLLDPAEPMHALLATDGTGGTVLGLAHFLTHRNTWMLGPVCYLQDLFTAEAARGRGVGRALIEAVADAATRAGAERLYWMTHESNAAARLLYDKIAERSGFIQYRRPLPTA